jgi:hypothetical protein
MIECHICDSVCDLYAKPGCSIIGYSCESCGKGYYTTDPDIGWREMKFTVEALQDLKSMHNIDIEETIYAIMKLEIEKSDG